MPKIVVTNRKLFFIVICCIILSVTLFTACSKSDPEKQNEAASQQNNVEVGNHQTNPPTNNDARKDLAISSPDVTDSASKPANGSDVKPNFDVDTPYDTATPTLMSFTVGMSADAVTHRFGKPMELALMDDGSRKLDIFEYPGFTIGLGAEGIVFIEVYSDRINPGLNGVKVGKSSKQVVDILGPPTSKNDYTISYESGGVMLKFDLDPNDQTIISIKLFEN